MVPAVTTILSLATIAGQAMFIAILLVLIISRHHLTDHRIGHFLAKHALLLSFLIALAATFGSLFYSDIAGYEPCKLCWYQRILMYPQAILLGMAFIRKEKTIAPYAITLSVIGFLLAGYHYLLQRNIVPALPCSAVGYSVSCSKVFVLQYGYITIPLMAATGFALITLLMIFLLKARGAQSR